MMLMGAFKVHLGLRSGCICAFGVRDDFGGCIEGVFRVHIGGA